MKVLLIDKHLVDSVNYYKWNLLADKLDVTIKGITPERWKENFRTIDYHKVEDAKFDVEPLPVFWPGYENRGFYTKGLIKAIKKEQPDVIICMEEPCSLFALQVTFATKISRSSSKLLFYSWYNLDPHTFYGYRPKFLYDWIIKYTLMNTDGVYCANNEALEFYSNRIGDKAKKLYFGVNLQLFRQAISTPISDHKKEVFRIGYIGRMMEMKNIETLIDAVASLRGKYNIQLRLLGNGDYKPFLKDYVKQKGVEDMVEFSDAVYGDKVGAYMQELDIQVLPSKSTKFWKEQYGRVLIEAMAVGVPSIGSSSGAIPEVIGDAGLIFEEQNSRDLSDKIENLIVNPAILKQLSVKCLERATMFSSEQFVDDLHQMLKKLF